MVSVSVFLNADKKAPELSRGSKENLGGRELLRKMGVIK